MTLKAIETFLHFTDCLSFSETARRMDCTQPAAFAHISLLQEDLGRPLYWRDNNSLKLTRTGHRLAASLRLYLEQVAASSAEMKADQLIPPLTLAASADITLFLLAPRLERFFSVSPQQQLHLRAFEADYAIEHVQQGRTQLALLEANDVPADLEATYIASWPFVLCGPNEASLGPEPVDLRALPLIAPPSAHPLRKQLDRVYGGESRRLHVRLEVPVYELMLKYVDLGLGLAVVPLYCVGDRPYHRITALAPTRLHLVERIKQAEGHRLNEFKRAIITSLQSL